MTHESLVRAWLFFAGVAVLVEQALVRYPDPARAQHAFWIAVSAFLLYRVSRHGHVARWVFLASAVVGFSLYAAGVATDGRQIGVTLAFAAQALAMLVPPVRQWTGAGSLMQLETHLPRRA
jgi:hypothetical protein